jgi:hypothetical protein
MTLRLALIYKNSKTALLKLMSSEDKGIVLGKSSEKLSK